jgi:hypothetical protein
MVTHHREPATLLAAKRGSPWIQPMPPRRSIRPPRPASTQCMRETARRAQCCGSGGDAATVATVRCSKYTRRAPSTSDLTAPTPCRTSLAVAAAPRTEFGREGASQAGRIAQKTRRPASTATRGTARDVGAASGTKAWEGDGAGPDRCRGCCRPVAEASTHRVAIGPARRQPGRRPRSLCVGIRKRRCPAAQSLL